MLGLKSLLCFTVLAVSSLTALAQAQYWLPGPTYTRADVSRYQRQQRAQQQQWTPQPSQRIPDKDGRGYTQRIGNTVIGVREGVTTTNTREGNWQYTRNSNGTVGARFYDEQRQVTKFDYRVPAEGYRVIGENPYPGNYGVQPWSQRMPLEESVPTYRSYDLPE